MYRDEAVEVLRSMLQAFASGDAGAADEFVSAEYVDHQGLGTGPLVGPGGFKEVVRVARSGFASLAVSIEDLLWDGDRLAARLRWHGVRADGRAVDRETIDILRFEDGGGVKAREHWGARLWVVD